MTMTTYFDERENAPAEEREQSLFSRLPQALRRACVSAPAIALQLEGVDPDSIRQRSDLERIPVLRKSDLLRIQSTMRTGLQAGSSDAVTRVFGGFSTGGWGERKSVGWGKGGSGSEDLGGRGKLKKK